MRAKDKIGSDKAFHYTDKFKLHFGKFGEYLVSVIYTKAYYYDYKKQELVEVVGVEKISCNLLKTHQLRQGEKNEN
ncbi:hypothetical protein HpEKB20_01140 [Helicobacter pylori]|nr:hypothetical protein VN0211_03860 [Helicobacter pylori]GHP34546.1 hypothetical protein VN1180_00190 [Helicobacter pylori]